MGLGVLSGLAVPEPPPACRPGPAAAETRTLWFHGPSQSLTKPRGLGTLSLLPFSDGGPPVPHPHSFIVTLRYEESALSTYTAGVWKLSHLQVTGPGAKLGVVFKRGSLQKHSLCSRWTGRQGH